MNRIKKAISEGDIPQYHIHFGGAELIVTDDPNRPKYDRDTFVCSKYADQISWLVYLLKDVYQDELNFMNKYEFYPGLGRAALIAMNKTDDLFDILESIIAEAERWHRLYFKEKEGN